MTDGSRQKRNDKSAGGRFSSALVCSSGQWLSLATVGALNCAYAFMRTALETDQGVWTSSALEQRWQLNPLSIHWPVAVGFARSRDSAGSPFELNSVNYIQAVSTSFLAGSRLKLNQRASLWQWRRVLFQAGGGKRSSSAATGTTRSRLRASISLAAACYLNTTDSPLPQRRIQWSIAPLAKVWSRQSSFSPGGRGLHCMQSSSTPHQRRELGPQGRGSLSRSGVRNRHG